MAKNIVTTRRDVYQDVTCRVCGGAARVVACIEDPVVIKTI